MKKVTISIENCLYDFYKKIGTNAGGLTPERVMADALFKLAGESSLNAINKNGRRKAPKKDA